MRLNGLKIQILSLVLLLASCASSEDFDHAVADQLKSNDPIKETIKNTEDNDNDNVDFVMGDRSGELNLSESDNDDEPEFAVPSEDKELELKLSDKEKILSTGNEVAYTYENREDLITFKNDGIHKQIYNKAESSFSLSYFMDNYDISDSRGVFQRSFVDASGAQRGGAILLNFDEYFSRGVFNTFYGFGLGLGYSLGKGVFSTSTGTESNVEFKLYSIPVDLRLGFDLVTSRYFRLSVSGGPSVLGLWQSRNDLERDDGQRYRRQVSYGYFANGKLQISISALSSSKALNMFSISDVTNMFLNLEARIQSYENFQDDLSITGASFGAGFTFEYF